MTACADGAEAGFSRDCATAVLTSDLNVSPDLHLSRFGFAARHSSTVRAFPGEGGGTDPLAVGADGSLGAAQVTFGTGGSLAISIPSAGNYQLVVSGDTGTIAGPISFSVLGPTDVALGTLTMATAGPFSTSDNVVTTQTPVITPGSIAELRGPLQIPRDRSDAGRRAARPSHWYDAR